MASLILENAVASSPASHQCSKIDRLAIVGAGDVVKGKIWPAVQANGFDLDGIAVCSLEEKNPLAIPPHIYHQVDSDCRLPLDPLEAGGFLTSRTLWIVATPSSCHVRYATQLARFSRVAVEKPLAADGAQAELLLPLAAHGFQVYPIDHKLFTASALAFIDLCRRHPSILGTVHRIEGRFFETSGISHGRLQEDCIADVQHHLLVPILAMFRSASRQPKMAIDAASASTHQPDPHGRFQPPTVWTASRLRGRLLWDGHTVTCDLLQAKGAPKSDKSIRLYDGDGRLLGDVDLNETGWHAHARVLAELLKPRPDMRYDLADAIAVMELIDRARTIASEEPTYRFGRLPGFLS